MKKIFIMLIFCATVLLSATEYTLERILEAALDNSYSIRQKEIMLRNADLGIRSATWNLLPSVEAGFRRSNTDEHYTSSGSLVVSRSLTLNEPTYFNYRQARLDKKIAELDRQQTRKEIVYSIYSAWLDLAQLQKEIFIRNENLSVLQRIKQQSELQQQLGQRTAFDVTQTEINVINAQLAISELQNQLAAKRADLFNKVKLDDDGSELLFSPAYGAELEPDFADDKAETLLLAKQKYDLRKSRLDKRQQFIGLFPTVNLSGSYGQYSPVNDVLRFEDYTDSYTISLGVSWSLWTPFTKGSSYAQMANNLALREWQLDESEASYKLEKANLKREWDYLSATLALNTKKAAQAKENLRIAQERYNLGTLSLIELEQARVNSLEADLAVNKISFQLQKKTQEWNLLNSLPVLDKY